MKIYGITKSTKQNYIWFHAPKTGTRSMLYILRNTTEIDLEDMEPELYKPEYDTFFRFTIVRNPWSRLLSAWKDKVQQQWSDKYPEEFRHWRIPCFKKYKDKDFNFFVKDIDPNFNSHTMPLCNLLDFGNVDFIGRFENLQEDFNTICDKIGIARQQLPHKNKTKHKHYTEYYDDETRSIVAEKFAKDIEYFGYKFGE